MAYIGNKPPVVSNLITDIKIGEDDETKIDFADANTINFHANNSKEMVLVENALTPGTSDGIALGTGSLMWSDLFLASGSVINLNNGDITLTHSSETLTVAGGTLATAALTTSTIVASGIIKTDDGTDATSTTDGSLQTDGGLSVAKDAVLGNDVLLLSDSAVLSLGADSDATLTHDGTTGLTIAANPFEVDSGGNITLDAHTGIFIFQDANSEVLRITESGSGDVTIKLETNAKDLIFTDNGDAEGFRILDAAAGVNVAGAITAGGIIKTDDNTNATSTTDGSLQTDGGLSVVLDAIFGDDVSLLTDSAVLNLGAGNDVSVTHDGTTGGTITGTPMAYETLGGGALANDTHGGVVIEFLAGESLAVGDWVYMSTVDGRVSKADSNDTADDGHYPAIGVAVSAQGSAGSAVKVLTHGVYNDSNGFGGDLTEGKQLFLSETAGTVTATAPSDDGDIVQVCGIAIGPRDVLVSPSLNVIEHA